jgi:glycosyltransferase involved in cell wall biosynthesis
MGRLTWLAARYAVRRPRDLHTDEALRSDRSALVLPAGSRLLVSFTECRQRARWRFRPVISVVIISKDEASLEHTLVSVEEQVESLGQSCEVVVVDASEGRLDFIRNSHEPNVRWLQFKSLPGARTSIPHQRNAGVADAAGEIIVFTDAGCLPTADWLRHLVTPLAMGEQVTSGVALGASGEAGLYGQHTASTASTCYLSECSTINMAFTRQAFDAVGGFDERYAYGSDVDFSWRLVDAGYRIRYVPDAIVRHDWGSWDRQLRRSYRYGKARARLYRKHPGRLRHVLQRDPMVVVYPAFLLGLPLTVVIPFYPALLLIPAWRNRSRGSLRVLVDHLAFGLGVLAELVGR